MKTKMNRTRRGLNEGVDIADYCRQEEPDHEQFKIDIWSEKGTGEYRMRIDGFRFLRLWRAESLQEIFAQLFTLDSKTVLDNRNVIPEELIANLPPERAVEMRSYYSGQPDERIIQYFASP